MQVARYLFQSPYTSPMQVGRLDPSSRQSSSDTNTQAVVQDQTQQKAQKFAQTQIQKVQSNVSKSTKTISLLDVVV